MTRTHERVWLKHDDWQFSTGHIHGVVKQALATKKLKSTTEPLLCKRNILGVCFYMS